MTDGPGPQTVTDWIRYLHNAAQEPKDSPHYAESRQAMAAALRHINALNVAQTQAEAQQTEYGKAVGAGPAAGVGLMQGLSLGSGEPIAGLISKLTGGTFREGAQRYREGLGNVGAQHPNIVPSADLAGSAMLPIGTIGPGLSAIKAGVPLTLGQGASLMARGAAGGAIPAAIAGFSAGGEDPGDIPARVSAAKRGAVVGAILGSLVTGVGAKYARGHVERVADLENKANVRALTASRLAESQARLAKAQLSPIATGATPEEAAVAKALGLSIDQVRGRVGTPENLPQPSLGLLTPPSTNTPPLGPPRPPSVIDPADAVPAYVRRGNPRGLPDIGTGKTLPYYPRGGKVEQAFGAQPVTSSPIGPTPLALQQLKVLLGMTDAELAEVEGMFPKDIMDQVRAIRAQGLLTP